MQASGLVKRTDHNGAIACFVLNLSLVYHLNIWELLRGMCRLMLEFNGLTLEDFNYTYTQLASDL